MKSLATLLMLGLFVGCSSNDSADEGSAAPENSGGSESSEEVNAAPASLPEVRYYLIADT